ncbi:hypothetical protein BH10CHL1_BH10CHL1_16770 [soil metagenome]
MVTTLSSKGQLVIPRSIRQALALKPGTKFVIEIEHEQIILKPLPETHYVDAAIEALYGKLAGEELLTMLENDRKWEIAHDNARYE